MEKIDVIEIWREDPIKDKQMARYFIAWNLFALGDGGHWHPEDDPHDARTREDEPYWTTEQADVLEQRTHECFTILGDDEVFEVLEKLTDIIIGEIETE